MLQTPAVLGQGFSDPVKDAQGVFRAVMDVTARPGTIRTLHLEIEAPAAIMPATAALALTLFDHDTPVWCDAGLRSAEIDAWLRFHAGAPLTHDPSASSFALISDPLALTALDRFAQGTSDYPDRSTTLILQCESLTAGRPLVLSGSGIKETARIAPSPLPDHFLDWLAVNRASFPCGVDLILVAGQDVTALPRTTAVKAMEA